MVPQSLAIINAHFPEDDRGRVIGLWAGISGAIAALGPWLGGWLIENYSWRAVFFINVPISLAALIIALLFIQVDVVLSGKVVDAHKSYIMAVSSVFFSGITKPND